MSCSQQSSRAIYHAGIKFRNFSIYDVLRVTMKHEKYLTECLRFLHQHQLSLYCCWVSEFFNKVVREAMARRKIEVSSFCAMTKTKSKMHFTRAAMAQDIYVCKVKDVKNCEAYDWIIQKKYISFSSKSNSLMVQFASIRRQMVELSWRNFFHNNIKFPFFVLLHGEMRNELRK